LLHIAPLSESEQSRPDERGAPYKIIQAQAW
jgi:hypothetical protein